MSLFNEFESVSYNEWLEKIISDLKGKDFDDNLVWNTDEGFTVQPIYHSEQLASNKSASYNLYNYSNNWEIREQISITTPEEANQKALIALKGGTNSLQFNGNINSYEDLELLLDGIMLSIISIHFYSNNPHKTTELFNEYTSKHQLNKSDTNYTISYDYLGESLTKGQLNKSIVLDTITINGFYYSNAGANVSQELAYSLNQAIAYIDIALEEGKPLNEILKSFQFNLGIGTNYFFEIAKIRAFKILWKMITAEYGFESTPYIHANTSNYHIAAQDAATNILRTTTGAMSAIIGEVNSLSVTPFNSAYEMPNNFTTRVARNIQLLIQEEAYLNKVSDAAKGAYYIESITDEIVESALLKFKEIEANGGFIENIKNNVIQNDIEKTHQNKVKAYSNKERTLLGVNKHPNANEEVREYNAPNSSSLHTDFNPLTAKNLASEITISLVNE